jgi:hypothetical protein
MFHPVEVFDMDGWSVRLLHRRGIPICDPLQQLVGLVQGCALRLAVVQRRRCFHFSWEENAAFRILKSPMKLIVFDQSQKKSQYFSS